jgi:hypothetical protein
MTALIGLLEVILRTKKGTIIGLVAAFQLGFFILLQWLFIMPDSYLCGLSATYAAESLQAAG